MPYRPVPAPVLLLPDQPVMRSQTYSAAMSYVGITRRTTAWARRVSSTPAIAVAAVVAAVLFLTLMYAVVTGWYVVIFGLFGVVAFPYRLVRRSHRKQEHLQRQQLATMQALLARQSTLR